MSTDNFLEPAILRTIVFFDIFQYPLTTVQCWRLLYDPEQQQGRVDLVLIEQCLNKLQDKKIVKCSLGFWQMASSPEYLPVRQQRYRLAAFKFRKVIRWVKLFILLPSVRLIALVNSVGYRNPQVTDDIDLFIVARQHKLWLTRFWLTGLAKIFGLRPTVSHQQDGLCFSFYLSDSHLNMTDLMIAKPDVYFHFWFTQITVLFDDGVGKQLVQANNDWLKNFPNLNINLQAIIPEVSRLVKTARFIAKLLTLSWFEPLVRMIQDRWLLPEQLKLKANQDTTVLITNEVLKFHEHDRREYYFKLWQQKLSDLNL
ncbi:MAG: hypothetical protein WC575_02745 [Patescibacteria group bacterium]